MNSDTRASSGGGFDTSRKTSRIDSGRLSTGPVSYTHLRAHETRGNLVCRLLLEKKKHTHNATLIKTTRQKRHKLLGKNIHKNNKCMHKAFRRYVHHQVHERISFRMNQNHHHLST